MVGTIGVIAVVWVIPSFLTRAPRVSGAQRQKAISDVRTGLAALVVAIGAVGSLRYTARTYRLGVTSHLTDRFQGASKLMSEHNASVRLAGIHAMAQLADEWAEQRQTCIDVICAYVRLSRPVQGDGAEESIEERRTGIRVIAERLRRTPGAVSWEGCSFDLTGAHLDIGDFRGVFFASGRFLFDTVHFSGLVTFDGAHFWGADVSFRNITVDGSGRLSFRKCDFRDGMVNFDGSEFGGGDAHFDDATFKGSAVVTFATARMGNGSVFFVNAQFFGSGADFSKALFVKGFGTVSFMGARFSGRIAFDGATFQRLVVFDQAVLDGAELSFGRAKVSQKGPKEEEGAKLMAGATLRFDRVRLDSATFLLEGVVKGTGYFDLANAIGEPIVLGGELNDPILFGRK